MWVRSVRTPEPSLLGCGLHSFEYLPRPFGQFVGGERGSCSPSGVEGIQAKGGADLRVLVFEFPGSGCGADEANPGADCLGSCVQDHCIGGVTGCLGDLSDGCQSQSQVPGVVDADGDVQCFGCSLAGRGEAHLGEGSSGNEGVAGSQVSSKEPPLRSADEGSPPVFRSLSISCGEGYLGEMGQRVDLRVVQVESAQLPHTLD